MRLRIPILCGFLLFTSVSATPAYAGPWSAFISWLSDLDPKTGGAGLEYAFLCKPAPCSGANDPDVRVKASAAVLFGSLGNYGGTIVVTPILGIVEKKAGGVYVGAGAGVITVGRTLQGTITRGLIQASVSVPVGQRFSIRGELNVIPTGFPAGTFSQGAAATGTEFVPGVGFVIHFR